MVEHSRVDHVSAAFVVYSGNKVLRLTSFLHLLWRRRKLDELVGLENKGWMFFSEAMFPPPLQPCPPLSGLGASAKTETARPSRRRDRLRDDGLALRRA
jgi:hypothetical protein